MQREGAAFVAGCFDGSPGMFVFGGRGTAYVLLPPIDPIVFVSILLPGIVVYFLIFGFYVHHRRMP